ncbi:flagellar hook-associated protein FlgL [Dethiothermospora halolimnae]|uniref:flagellar hook-associated protein FlgL n=1 Tax=Dethiothermospora halolimnae TaxID=3114390 RepID=UPI003CCC29FE
MRITNSMMISDMMRNLNNNMERMNKTYSQYTTGKKFQLPSDDPIGVSKSLKLHTDVSVLEQYKRNADDARSWLDITETTLKEMGDVIHRARELTVDAANDTKTPEDRKKIGEEIKQLKEHLIKLGNTTYAGRYIFSGFKTDQKLLDEDGNYDLNGENLKNTEISKYNIGVATDIEVNTVGTKVFGNFDGTNLEFNNSDVSSGDTPALIQAFTKLEKALDGTSANPQDDIQESIANMDKVLNNTLAVRSEVGAKTNRLEITQQKLDSQILNFTKLLSNNEDADMARVIIDLKTQESVYRASLSSGSRIIQPTLIDFLR